MVSSQTEPPTEPPSKEFDPVVAPEYETLDECLDEMDLCNHAVDIVPPTETYATPVSLVYRVAKCYPAFQATSVALAAWISEIVVKWYDFELLKMCFKTPEPRKDFALRAPEGGDESGKVAYVFLQKMKNYFSDEVAEIFRWNGYGLQGHGSR